MTKRRNVLIFGKTGSGKSTIANMLLKGSLKNPEFTMGNSMQGVTNKCKTAKGAVYKVTDTVGLGEETETERKNAEQMVMDFLKKTQASYHHIIFAKRAGRQDQLDPALWEIFLKIFQEDPSKRAPDYDVYRGMVLVFTECKADWIGNNKEEIEKRYSAVKGRFTGVDFPPIDEEDEEFEEYLSSKREKQLGNLTKTLDSYYHENGLNGQALFRPKYCDMDEAELKVFCRKILETVSKWAVKLGKDAGEFLRGLFQLSVEYGVDDELQEVLGDMGMGCDSESSSAPSHDQPRQSRFFSFRFGKTKRNCSISNKN